MLTYIKRECRGQRLRRRKRRGRGREREREREITVQGEMEDKRGKRWSGRTREWGSFKVAALLNSSAGVQRGLGCTANGIFNNPWERIHTHTENTQKHARTCVHRGWHFLSAPLFPLPGSPSHHRQQDSLPARGNERSSWREEDQGRREEIRRKKEGGCCWGGQPDTTPSPPHHRCVWTEYEFTQPQSTDTPETGHDGDAVVLFFLIDPLLTGQSYNMRMNSRAREFNAAKTCCKTLIL